MGALIPYGLLALFILTFILLAQQFSRFAEIMGAARAPLTLALEVTTHLVPSVLIFTIPMAMLVGTATGFCRLGSDSELTAMRAAGVGTWRIIAPVLFLGSLVGLGALYVAFVVAPASASALRDAALVAAIQKLESPVDPRSFYTELPGKVIYVRDGDQETGQWGRVFIHWQESGGPLRLVTAKSGRIDTAGEQTELVLTDARITTLPPGGVSALASGGSITTEHSAHLRLRDDRLSSARTSLIKRVRERQAEPDEMGWRQLWERARGGETDAQRLLAQTALHKRLSLCLAPVAFALLGAGMGLRVRRGGRALGVALSLLAMLLYYLVSLAGEQLARSGAVPPAVALWVPFVLSLGAAFFLLRAQDSGFNIVPRPISSLGWRGGGKNKGSLWGGGALIRGLLNKSVLADLTRYFVGTFVVLTFIFLVFTLFELLRFIVINAASGWLVAKYLLFLLPLVSVTVAPMSVLLTVLITYSVMVRRSELVAWWGSGQSIYRIVMPAIFFAGLVAACFWLLQERVMPTANRRQNQLRAQIRGGGARRAEVIDGRQWLATENTRRVYSYVFDAETGGLKTPAVFEFDAGGVHLTGAWWGELGYWRDGPSSPLILRNPQGVEFKEGEIAFKRLSELPAGGEQRSAFKPSLSDPTEMNSRELSAYIRALNSREVASGALIVALERKRASLLDPLVMVLIGAPASLAFGRRSTVAALCAAVLLGLFFWGTVSVFGHIGSEGLLPARIAAWVPPFLFSVVGVYLLLKVRT